ncbi:MAG: hypothetical protein A2145_04595 [candidate division Zixibacteria bacterium RBG_16_40_9]|nr:MAG: hypothetical protein A2145_04595 [candidate division Zixibacteria bacterium RBG_16_40_9]
MSNMTPGGRDTLFFCGVKSYVYGPPYTGHIRVDFGFYHDENLVGIEVPLVWIGPVEFYWGTFSNTRVESLTIKTLIFDEVNQRILVQAVAIPPGPDLIRPGKGKLVEIIAMVSDTGTLILDSITFDSHSLRFVPEEAVDIAPVFNKLVFRIESDTIKPGDIDLNGDINMADLITLVNYLFRGWIVSFKPATDVNSDCRVSLPDVITMVNYFFKSGPQLKPGCAWD